MRVNVVHRKETGQYRVKITAKDETGRWITRWVKGGFPTEQHARAKKAEIEANAARGNIDTLDSASVGVYVQEWLDLRLAMGQIEASSHWTYQTALKRVLPHLGHLPLATLTGQDIQAAYAKITATKGRSAAAGAHVVFQNAIRDAVKAGRLLADPFTRVEPPRKPKTRKSTTLTMDEVHAFVAHHAGSPMGTLIELLAVSGLRVGEACALQWRDLDFATNKLRVERNIGALKNGKSYVKTPKTQSGFRTVSIPPETMARLKLKLGKPSEFVFGTTAPRTWSRRLTKAMRQNGLEAFTTHDLRHAHATFLLKHTPNPKIVSKRLGHSDVKITLAVYAHVFEGDDEELGSLAAHLLPKAL